jgi:benzoyl-CoA reductase/2-hydroxyglutaryl-CoA dehydratase subunit BcrC/BadD/HgdB
VNNVKDLEAFMIMVGAGMKGVKGDDYYFNQPSSDDDEDEKDEEEKDKEVRATYQSVRNAWNNFCGWCQQKGHPISPENKEYMTKVR